MVSTFSRVCFQYVCVCVCGHPIYSGCQTCGPAGVTQEEGHKVFLHLTSAVLGLILIARRIQPSLSPVDREVEFVYPRINRSPLVGHNFFWLGKIPVQ